jgi:hypothetical protein
MTGQWYFVDVTVYRLEVTGGDFIKVLLLLGNCTAQYMMEALVAHYAILSILSFFDNLR